MRSIRFYLANHRQKHLCICLRMVQTQIAMVADAIVNIRFGSSAVMQGAAEVIAYGTAVKLK